jgi:4-amino-4-deoxy-L-arabinose transferase-like glycosyltransferase
MSSATVAVAPGFRLRALRSRTTPTLDPDSTAVSTLVGVVPNVDIEPLVPAPAPESTEPEPRPLVPVWVWLLAILFVAVFVRTWGLNRAGFNSDETVYAGQAASIAGNVTLQKFFPIYRAHPLLFQTLLSVLYKITTSDYAARLLSAAFGVATVFLTYLSGKLLYGRRAGLIGAALLAVMPYHVVVTRQVLLDGPLVFFSTLTLYLAARYAVTQRPIWLYATGAGMGLTFLSKETGFVLLAAVYAFLALAPRVKVRIRDLVISGVVMACVMLPYPLSLYFGNSSKTGKSFFAWQLLRRPNHGAFFYFTTVPGALGYILLAAAIAGLWVLRKERSWREVLLLAWILVPVGFFQLWPVKGFQYFLPIATPIAILAGRSLARMPVNWRRSDTSTGASPIVSGVALAAAPHHSTDHAVLVGHVSRRVGWCRRRPRGGSLGRRERAAQRAALGPRAVDGEHHRVLR